MLTGKRIFISGGAGFIGSALAGRLVDQNQVTLYDNLARNALKDREFRDHANLRLLQGDVLDREDLEEAVRDAQPTHVVHCAAIAGIDTVVRRPVHTMEVNMTGTANLLRAASALRVVERVICFSTSEIFGPRAFLSDEQDPAVVGAVGEARWTYAVSKLAGEHLALAYHKERQLPVAVLRPFNVYGPGQVGEGALSIFIQRALQDEDLVVHGTGAQIRAWCYVDDMVKGVLTALEHPGAVGETFNIGNQRATVTIYDLARTVKRMLNSQSEIRFVQRNQADVELRIPDVTKARELLGFEAEVDLEEGIRRTAEYVAAQLVAHR